MIKIQLKLEMAHGIKKVRKAPDDFDAFNLLVDANVKDQSEKRSYWYQDEAKDWITITDDDDLQLAYDTAINHFDGHLRVFVKPFESKDQQPVSIDDQMPSSLKKQLNNEKDIVNSDYQNMDPMKSIKQDDKMNVGYSAYEMINKSEIQSK